MIFPSSSEAECTFTDKSVDPIRDSLRTSPNAVTSSSRSSNLGTQGVTALPRAYTQPRLGRGRISPIGESPTIVSRRTQQLRPAPSIQMELGGRASLRRERADSPSLLTSLATTNSQASSRSSSPSGANSRSRRSNYPAKRRRDHGSRQPPQVLALSVTRPPQEQVIPRSDSAFPARVQSQGRRTPATQTEPRRQKFLCDVEDCPRKVEGFFQMSNLKRHKDTHLPTTQRTLSRDMCRLQERTTGSTFAPSNNNDSNPSFGRRGYVPPLPPPQPSPRRGKPASLSG